MAYSQPWPTQEPYTAPTSGRAASNFFDANWFNCIKQSKYSGDWRWMRVPRERITDDVDIWWKWSRGEISIEEAFPDLTESERDFMLTGMVPAERKVRDLQLAQEIEKK